jgi:hypothetical protein
MLEMVERPKLKVKCFKLNAEYRGFTTDFNSQSANVDKLSPQATDYSGARVKSDNRLDGKPSVGLASTILEVSAAHESPSSNFLMKGCP